MIWKQEMSREVGCLNSLVSHFFIEKCFFSVFASFKVNFKKKSRKILLARCTNYLNKENSDSVKVFSGLVNITLKIRPDWKLIAVTRWNHTELVPWWNFAPVFKTEVKSPRGEISPRLERVTTYRSFLIDRGNFAPGRNLTYDGPLKVLKYYYLLSML